MISFVFLSRIFNELFIQLYQHEWKLEKQETKIRVFLISTSVDITVYQYKKNLLCFLYNLAKKTLKEQRQEICRVVIDISTRLFANQRSEFTNAIL